MTMPAPSFARRAVLVIENTTRHLAVPLASFIVSYIVISATSPELWGRFAINLIVVNLTVHLLAWGNKEYLLRSMSTDAGSAAALWQSSLLTRSLALLPAIAALSVFGLARPLLPWIALWTAAAFLTQSFDPVILYLHRFRLAIVAEAFGLATTLALVASRITELDEIGLVMSWVAGVVVKTAVLAVGLSPTLGRAWHGRVEPDHVTKTLPFVLLALSGLLHSKVDLYAMALLAEPDDVGRYQVTAGLYIALQATAAFLLMPFVRELYERSDTTSHRTARRMTVVGVGVAALGGPVSWIVLNEIYGFELGWPVFVIGAALVLPSYRIAPRIYLLYKHGRERTVALFNLAGAGVNLALAVALIPRYSIAGALGAAAASLWFLLIVLEALVRRNNRADPLS